MQKNHVSCRKNHVSCSGQFFGEIFDTFNVENVPDTFMATTRKQMEQDSEFHHKIKTRKGA